jgi:LuxR family maltose regulon positive regulatory protein
LNEFLQRGEVATVLRWLDALPEDENESEPTVPLAKCWAYFISGKSLAIEPHLERAAHIFKRGVDDGILRGKQKDTFAAQLAMMRSVLARGQGDHAGSVAHAEKAARLMPEDMLDGKGTAWNMIAAARAGAGDYEGAIEAFGRGIELAFVKGNLVGAYGCIYGQAMYTLVQGRMNEAERLCRAALDRAIAEGHGDFPAAGSLYITMARIHMERYHLEDVEINLDTGLRIARPGGIGEAERAGRYLLAHLSAARGDLDTALKSFEDMARIVKSMHDPYLYSELNWEWAKLCFRMGDLDGARDKLRNLEEMIAIGQHANMLLGRMWLYPRLLYAEDRYDEALTALEESIHWARDMNSNGELIRLLPLQAVVLNAAGDRLSAGAPLREALVLGSPEGYIWRWLMAGPEIVPLLQDLRGNQDIAQEFHPYLDYLLDACQTEFGEISQPKPEGLPDLLTARELEIMHLICKGYSNPEIASELVVTINTIKKHTSNIYSKLGVRSRTQAIAQVHKLNLL